MVQLADIHELSDHLGKIEREEVLIKLYLCVHAYVCMCVFLLWSLNRLTSM